MQMDRAFLCVAVWLRLELYMIKISSHSDIAQVADKHLKAFLLGRVKQIFSVRDWQADKEGYVIVVEDKDDIRKDYQFVGREGLVSDLFDAARVGDDEFASPFEVISHHPLHPFYEAHLQCNDEMGITFMIPESVASLHPDLKLILTKLEVPFNEHGCSFQAQEDCQ